VRPSVLDSKLVGAITRAAADRLLVAFDLDGTLAPLRRRFQSATIRPVTRVLLQDVADRYPTIVLTGRSRRDAASKLRGVRLAAIVGNHGLEDRDGHAGARACVRKWKDALDAGLPPDAEVENKGESLSIHFRRARNPAQTRRRVLRALASLSPKPRLIAGKALVNVVPDFGVHKGTALAALMRRHRARAIYVGDDLTDEDVFAMPASNGVVTVRVGKSRRSKARHHIRNQRDIDDLLAVLVNARG
jgi:trehalose 6-phosphate phosphatase